MRWKTAKARRARRRPNAPVKALPAVYGPLLGPGGELWRVLASTGWAYIRRTSIADPVLGRTVEMIHEDLMYWLPPTLAELRQLALAESEARTSHLLAPGREVLEDDVEGAIWTQRQEGTL